ncbi:Sensor histidine kinase YycG [Actinomyces bovis]|uniref:Sensor histidine kinase MtrB n=1 Tax=Actinomyces bovis TaxID=1658 RepID=A0ABY1VN19_9ACTO|nr:MtrAB system histidine kinase MtrB [Actinomyces bovis]SPT53334.1 Sensor histidine kinase YycG [Actinomyces bovis]VEG52693.1 Sensor histidine kinase YycG [Actinomyces israelii]
MTPEAQRGGWRNLSVVKSLRHSVTMRLTVLAVGIGGLMIVLLLVLVTSHISSDIFDNKRDAVLKDAHTRARVAQVDLDSATISSGEDVAVTVQKEISRIRDSFAAAGGIGVVLNRAADEDSGTVINDLATDVNLSGLVTPELAAQVEASGPGVEHWQSISVPSSNKANPGKTNPGLIVGTQINLPMAGQHNLYLIYTLAPEQRVLTVTARAMTVASIGFATVLILMVSTMAWRVLMPVRQTSLAAQRLARGLLTERLDVHGADELAVLARSFNTMADNIEEQISRYDELSQLQRRFVSDVSHELRTPLTTIRLAGEQIFAAREDFDDPVLKRSAVILFGQLERFATMLEDLLTISRIDAGASALHLKEVDMVEVVRDVLGMAAPLAAEKNTDVRLHVPDGPVRVALDRTRVERIVRNLVINALEHGESKPLDVTVAQNAGAVAVRVRDHGIGMSEKVVAHVFDRFFRADPSRKRSTGGTGLGLSISQEDATLHGGELTAWGWPGAGSSFLLTLPRVPGEPIDKRPLELIPDDAPAEALAEARTKRAFKAVSSTRDGEAAAKPIVDPRPEIVPPPRQQSRGPVTRYADATGVNPPVVVTAEPIDDTDETLAAVEGLLKAAGLEARSADHLRVPVRSHGVTAVPASNQAPRELQYAPTPEDPEVHRDRR